MMNVAEKLLRSYALLQRISTIAAPVAAQTVHPGVSIHDFDMGIFVYRFTMPSPMLHRNPGALCTQPDTNRARTPIPTAPACTRQRAPNSRCTRYRQACPHSYCGRIGGRFSDSDSGAWVAKHQRLGRIQSTPSQHQRSIEFALQVQDRRSCRKTCCSRERRSLCCRCLECCCGSTATSPFALLSRVVQ